MHPQPPLERQLCPARAKHQAPCCHHQLQAQKLPREQELPPPPSCSGAHSTQRRWGGGGQAPTLLLPPAQPLSNSPYCYSQSSRAARSNRRVCCFRRGDEDMSEAEDSPSGGWALVCPGRGEGASCRLLPARLVVPAAPGLTQGGRRAEPTSRRKRAACSSHLPRLRLYKLTAPPAEGTGGRWENGRARRNPHPTPLPTPQLVALAGQLLGDEFPKALEVLAVQFNVIVPGPIHPQRLHGLGAAFKERQAMGEVDDFVLRAVDDEDGRGDFGDLLNAVKKGGGEETRDRVSTRIEAPLFLLPPETAPQGKAPGNAL